MFSKSIATWLVVLVVAPFTAPFPTCDLLTLFGDVHRVPETAPVSPPHGQVRATRGRRKSGVSEDDVSGEASVAMHADSSRTPIVPPVSTQLSTENQFPNAVMGAAANRLRLLLLTRVGSAGNNNNSLLLSTSARRSRVRVNCPRGVSAVASVLRV